MISLTRSTAPWAFARGGEPYRSIAALEAFATLMAVMVFQDKSDKHRDHVLTLPTLTDNQGNESALRQLSSNTFPLSIVIMELSAQLEARSARLDLHWIPRESNVEADRLSNGDHTGFNPCHPICVDVSKIEWLVLDKLARFGLLYQEAGRGAIEVDAGK